ncbi:MAG: bifunctional folylpolyglutamate synthase/dihydrofolate synthase [Proteobacteria bacterium]|nr:bifunctional folylpolyglutamate synthase/dihydrofolate synthase [Pseudomonadota bacterium]
MSYTTALNRLYQLSPRGIRLGLERIRAVAAELGDPHISLRCVQVAGTNGKGTVASLISHAARAAGLKVGLYTSPHLHRFKERIQIDGVEADPDLLGPELKKVLDLAEKETDLALTFFEVATLAAFLVFAKSRVDLAVLEVGLGGRLDATSIAAPEVSVITSIGFDHTELLGNTLSQIAREKASIARPGVPLVTGQLPPEAMAAVEELAHCAGAQLHVLGRDFDVSPELTPPWPGAHQKRNAAVAHKVFELLNTRDPRFESKYFTEALPSARWPGRFEIIEDRPKFILDGAHNLEATQALLEAIKLSSLKLGGMVFGALKGKPVERMLNLLRPLANQIILVSPPIQRALDPCVYAKTEDHIAQNVKEGIESARGLVGNDETILVTGSLFTVAEARRLLLDEPADPQIGL